MRIRALFPLAAGLLTPLMASAQQPPLDPGQFTPPTGSPAVNLLREIFGNLVDFALGNTGAAELGNNGTVMAAGFEIFNIGVLFLGLIFVAYTSILGVVNTAHDGEFLGRRMSSVWVPARTVGFSGLLLPLAGGYSVIQVVIMWLALQGAGFGDSVWTSMLTRIKQDGMVGHPSIPDARPLAANVFRFEVCRAAMNKQYGTERVTVVPTVTSRKSTVPTNAAVPLAPFALTNTSYRRIDIPVVDWHWSSPGYMDGDVCGSLQWEESPQSQEGNAIHHHLGSVYVAHAQAVKAMITTLRPVAEAVVAGQKPAAGPIESAAYAYERALQAAAMQAVNAANERNGGVNRSSFVEFAEQGGWAGAGAYYNHIIQLNDSVQLAVNAMPASTSVGIDQKETQEALIGFKDAMLVAEEFLMLRADAAHAAYENERANENCLKPLPTTWEAVKRCLSKPALIGIEQMTQEMSGSNTSHVAQVKNIGDNIITAGWALIGMNFAANFAAGTANISVLGTDAGTGLSDAVKSLGFLISFLTLALLSAGMMLAFYIPMIPFIAWITGMIKWVVSVTEALIAAPIFAAAHIHPDGDDAIGRAGPGYMIILSMICRPVLMLFGLMASIAVAQPIAHMVNALFMMAVKGAMHDSANGLVAFIAYVVIYGIIMTTVIHAVFSLIHFIPDNGLRFMGSAIGMHGVGDSEDRESQQVFVGAARHTREAPGSMGPKPKAAPGGSGPRGGGGTTKNSDHSPGGGGRAD